MTRVDDPKLPLRLARTDQAIDVALVSAQPTMLHAIKLCIAAAGFESEKQVYNALEIDAGHWSRITRGEAHFPVDKLSDLMNLCGNEAPLIWLAHARGYDPCSLRPYESLLERENRELREQLSAIEREREIERRAIRELIGMGG